jgi:hypothetical protein
MIFRHRIIDEEPVWKFNLVNIDYQIVMKWSRWPLTVFIAAISLVISYVLFQLGIYFFFLPIIFFIPFATLLEPDSIHALYVKPVD